MSAAAGQVAAPAVIVDVAPGRAPVEEITGAVDAALRSGLDGLAVRIALEASDPRRAPLERLCGADARITVTAPGDPPSAPVVIALPAHARPEPRTLGTVVDALRSEGLAAVEVTVPGIAARGAPRRLRATAAAGSGTKRLRAADVGLRSVTSRRDPAPPPQGSLAEERAEHLRHRARGATMRARMDRNAHRLARERLQTRHERTRLYLAEQRLGESGAGEWIRWRSRAVGRRAAALPGVANAGVSKARVFGRRARRFATDRWRSRSSDT